MPHVEIPQASFKVVLLGDSHIGKTSLVTRFSEGYYRENSRPPTIAAFFVTKCLQTSENVTCKVQIWDTAGQVHFRPMAKNFYSGAAAVIVCYDVTSWKSFQVMRDWLEELREVKTKERGNSSSSGEMVIAIAALKDDLLQNHHHQFQQQKQHQQQQQQQQVHSDGGITSTTNHNDSTTNSSSSSYPPFVPEDEVKQLADTLGCIFLPTSAKANRNVQALFQRVADEVLLNRKHAKLNKMMKQGNLDLVASPREGVDFSFGKERHTAVEPNGDPIHQVNTASFNGTPNNLTLMVGSTTDKVNAAAISAPNTPCTTPRRGKYDKYYVRESNDIGNSENNSRNNNNSNRTPERKTPPGNAGKRRGIVRTVTPNAEITVENDLKNNLLLQGSDTNNKSESSSYRMCSSDEPFSCQPVACGAGDIDGNAQCSIQ